MSAELALNNVMTESMIMLSTVLWGRRPAEFEVGDANVIHPPNFGHLNVV